MTGAGARIRRLTVRRRRSRRRRSRRPRRPAAPEAAGAAAERSGLELEPAERRRARVDGSVSVTTTCCPAVRPLTICVRLAPQADDHLRRSRLAVLDDVDGRGRAGAGDGAVGERHARGLPVITDADALMPGLTRVSCWVERQRRVVADDAVAGRPDGRDRGHLGGQLDAGQRIQGDGRGLSDLDFEMSDSLNATVIVIWLASTISTNPELELVDESSCSSRRGCRWSLPPVEPLLESDDEPLRGDAAGGAGRGDRVAGRDVLDAHDRAGRRRVQLGLRQRRLGALERRLGAVDRGLGRGDVGGERVGVGGRRLREEPLPEPRAAAAAGAAARAGAAVRAGRVARAGSPRRRAGAAARPLATGPRGTASSSSTAPSSVMVVVVGLVVVAASAWSSKPSGVVGRRGARGGRRRAGRRWSGRVGDEAGVVDAIDRRCSNRSWSTTRWPSRRRSTILGGGQLQLRLIDGVLRRGRIQRRQQLPLDDVLALRRTPAGAFRWSGS